MKSPKGRKTVARIVCLAIALVMVVTLFSSVVFSLASAA